MTDISILERCLNQDTTQDQNVTSCVKVGNQCVFKLSWYRHISQLNSIYISETKSISIKTRHFNLQTLPFNPTGSHPTMSSGLVQMYSLGRPGVETYQHPDGGRPGVETYHHPDGGSFPLKLCLTFKNHASYIQDRHTATLQMLHFIYIFF